jgi:lysine 2,3-aminomutase
LKSEAISKQFIPNKKEMIFGKRSNKDPLNEEKKMPVKNLIHMYPDRALLLVTDMCFSYCRFCTRKRFDRKYLKINRKDINNACRYIAKNEQIKDVIISGGDPLILSDSDLLYIIKKISKIKNVKVIRIGTRAPIVSPQRITDGLIKILKQFYPLYINIHVDHPDELSPESIMVIEKMAKAGIILGSQSVLLKGINDSEKIMKKLFYSCISIGLKPYYLYQCDEVKGTEYFWTNYQKMFNIAKSLVGKISGLAVPNFIFDCRCAMGKVHILPEFYKNKTKKSITFKTCKNKLYTYYNLSKEELRGGKL